MTRAANPVPDDGRDGEVAALYRSHARAVWAVAYARHLDRDLALDVVQDTFLRFWAQRDHGGAIENPRAWLMRVAKNLAEDHAKSAFRRNGTQPGDSLGRLSSAGPSPPVPGCNTVMPRLRVTTPNSDPACATDASRTASWMRVAQAPAPASSVLGSSTANSSPP